MDNPNIIFTLAGKPNKHGEKTIAMRVNGKQQSTGITWPPCQWHRGKPTGLNASGVTAEQLAKHLAMLKASTMYPEHTMPDDVLESPQALTMPRLAEMYIKTKSIVPGTAISLRYVAKRYGNDPITKEGIEAFLTKRFAELTTVSYNVERHRIMSFIRFAIESRLLPADFKVFAKHERVIENVAVFLNEDEVNRIANIHLPPELDEERHRLLFQCLTGIRASDLATISEANIQGNELHVTMRKTSVAVSIPLTQSAKAHLAAIIGKPVPDTSKRDRLIKEICRLAGIDTPTERIAKRGNEITKSIVPKWQIIGTHTGRRTFICNLIAKGVSPTVIMSMTGHKSYESLRKYISVADPTKTKAVELLDY